MTTAKRAWLFQARLPFWFWFSLSIHRRRPQRPTETEIALCMTLPWPAFCQHYEYHDGLWPLLDPGDISEEWKVDTLVDQNPTAMLSGLPTLSTFRHMAQR